MKISKIRLILSIIVACLILLSYWYFAIRPRAITLPSINLLFEDITTVKSYTVQYGFDSQFEDQKFFPVPDHSIVLETDAHGNGVLPSFIYQPKFPFKSSLEWVGISISDPDNPGCGWFADILSNTNPSSVPVGITTTFQEMSRQKSLTIPYDCPRSETDIKIERERSK